GLDVKELLSDWWSGLDSHLGIHNSSVRFEPPKPRSWREVEIGPSVYLFMGCEPEENWISAGLVFSGKKGLSRFEAAKAQLETLTDSLGVAVEVEEDNTESALTMYRFASVPEKKNWEAY